MSFYLLDLETTGLGNEGDVTDYILELGLAVYDDNLEFLTSRTWLVGDRQTAVRFNDVMDEGGIVSNMHNKSFLAEEWADAYSAGKVQSYGTVQDEAIEWLIQEGLARHQEPMVGSSIHFDRERFLTKYMPYLNDLFHYRNIDASAIRAFESKRRPQFVRDCEDKLVSFKKASHRVQDDIHDTVNLLRVLDGLEPKV